MGRMVEGLRGLTCYKHRILDEDQCSSDRKEGSFTFKSKPMETKKKEQEPVVCWLRMAIQRGIPAKSPRKSLKPLEPGGTQRMNAYLLDELERRRLESEGEKRRKPWWQFWRSS